ncbi:MAG: hypothetical protein DMF89_18040 [Acidobacteria bacterium]|nr:MAG: hypothetical protein DMF89_18040 [Acidobacteriota bacterium]
MFGYDAAVVVFTLGAFAVWAYALSWALKQPKYRWYHTWVLVLVTLFWFIGESLAIRLGKYEYLKFPANLRVNLPFGGTPQNPRWVEEKLVSLIPPREGSPKFDPSCKADSYAIPLPVVAIEAALLFGFFRLAASFLKVNKSRWRTSTATGGLCALLLVNSFAALDPVVSTTRWCELGVPNPTVTYLPFGLWNWFTTQTHQGYWFGVPTVNYAAWFVAAAVFGFLARWDGQRDDLLIRKYKIWIGYAAATIVILAIYVPAALGVTIVVDLVLVHGQEYLFGQRPVFAPKMWQLGVVALLLGLALIACWSGRRQSRIKIGVVAVAPKALALSYCLWLLLRFFHGGIFVVWSVSVAVAVIVLGWPFIARRVFGYRGAEQELELQPRSGVDAV